jgi:hypothetical protein
LSPFNTSNQELKNIQEIREEVKLHLLKEQEVYKTRVDTHRKPISFDIGEKIMLKNTKIPERGLAKRFLPLFMGLFTVEQKMNELTYVVKCDKTGKLVKTHVNRMKRIKIFELNEEDDDPLFFNSFQQFYHDIYSPTNLIHQLKTLNLSCTFTEKFVSYFLPFHVFVQLDPNQLISNNFLSTNNIKTIINLSLHSLTIESSVIHTTDPVHISHQTNPIPFTYFQISEFLTKSNLTFFNSNFTGNSLLIIAENPFEFLFKLIILRQTQIHQYPQVLTLLIEIYQQIPSTMHLIRNSIEEIQSWFPKNNILTDSDSDSDSDPEFPSLSQARNDKNNHFGSTSGPSKRTSKRVKYKPHWHSSYVFPKS